MNVNRIFCIGKNYAEHISELAHVAKKGSDPISASTAGSHAPVGEIGSDPFFAHIDDGQCLIFMKPPSSVVPAGAPIPLPRNRGSVHHEAELVIRLSGGGAEIPAARALAHVDAITLGLDLTLRELQGGLKKKGAPWELAKAFDGAAPLGAWTPYKGQDLQALEFTCHVNGALRQSGNTADMLFPVPRLIHILSGTWALQPGDVVFTGTPAGVGPLVPGDRVTLESAAMGRFEWPCR